MLEISPNWITSENFLSVINVNLLIAVVFNRAVFIWLFKVIGFASTLLHDWLKKLTPLFHPIRKPKPRALRQLHVITTSLDWFTGLSVSLWLARVIALVLFFQHWIKNLSKTHVEACFDSSDKFSSVTSSSKDTMSSRSGTNLQWRRRERREKWIVNSSHTINTWSITGDKN